MSFDTYSSENPTKIKNLRIRLEVNRIDDLTLQKTAGYSFDLCDNFGNVVTHRSGSLSNPGAIEKLSTTSITAGQINSWLDEVFALAEETLPAP